MDGNIHDTMLRVAAAKRRDNNWLWIGIPMVVAWTAWVGWEMTQKMDGENMKYFMPFFIICLVSGLLIGLAIRFKTQRHYRDILEQIEDAEEL